MPAQVTPLGAVGRGLAAGIAGTGLMTVAQELAARRRAAREAAGQSGGEPSGDAQPQDPWEQASTPAKVARRISVGVFEHDVPARRIGVLTHAMHWGYGTGWGAVYGLIAGTFGGRPLRGGLTFGAAVWGMSYLQLVPMGLYEPPWRYSTQEIAEELGYHLVYGVGVAAAERVLDRV
jgi:hypothetical protein